MASPRQPVAGRPRGRPRGINPIGSPEEAIAYLRRKCGIERAKALSEVASEVLAITRADPLGAIINKPEIDAVLAGLRTLVRALRSVRPAALTAELWSDEKTSGGISVWEPSQAPTLRGLLELAERWIESMDPAETPDNPLPRLARHRATTFMAGWLVAANLEPKVLELVALEMLLMGDSPSSEGSELVRRKERWQRALKRARTILQAESRRRPGRYRRLPTALLTSADARRKWLARALLSSSVLGD